MGELGDIVKPVIVTSPYLPRISPLTGGQESAECAGMHVHSRALCWVKNLQRAAQICSENCKKIITYDWLVTDWRITIYSFMAD